MTLLIIVTTIFIMGIVGILFESFDPARMFKKLALEIRANPMRRRSK